MTGRWTLALKRQQQELAKETSDRTDIKAVLDLARYYTWGVCVIVGGGWTETDSGERELLLGEVVGGDEAHWRAFAERATHAQLQEATTHLQALATAA
jgi:hypothetical protein